MRHLFLCLLIASPFNSFAKPTSKVQAQLDRMEYQIEALSSLLERQSRIQNSERHAIEQNQICIDKCDEKFRGEPWIEGQDWHDRQMGKCVDACPKVPKTVYGGGC